MSLRDHRDILGGAVLIGVGAFAAFHAVSTLSLGTVSQMGPGMFPTALGVILAALGVIILVPALFRTGEMPSVDVRSFLAISASIFAFAAMAKPFGLIPAIAVMTLVASRADSKLTPIAMAILIAGLSLGAVLIFRVGLGVQLRALNLWW